MLEARSPCLETRGVASASTPEGNERNKLREMDRDKQSSKRAFGAYSEHQKLSWEALSCLVILVELPR